MDILLTVGILAGVFAVVFIAFVVWMSWEVYGRNANRSNFPLPLWTLKLIAYPLMGIIYIWITLRNAWVSIRSRVRLPERRRAPQIPRVVVLSSTETLFAEPWRCEIIDENRLPKTTVVLRI